MLYDIDTIITFIMLLYAILMKYQNIKFYYLDFKYKINYYNKTLNSYMYIYRNRISLIYGKK